MFLAQLAPLHEASPSEAMFFYLFIGACVVILGIVVAVATLIHYSKRKPSIESEFATKAEMNTAMAGMKAEMHREVAGLKSLIEGLDQRNEERSDATFRKLDDMFRAFNISIQEIHRALGRLEGTK